MSEICEIGEQGVSIVGYELLVRLLVRTHFKVTIGSSIKLTNSRLRKQPLVVSSRCLSSVYQSTIGK